MSERIRLKRSATPGAVPAAGQLVLGELAINTADGRVYLKTDAGEIDSLAKLSELEELASQIGAVGDALDVINGELA